MPGARVRRGLGDLSLNRARAGPHPRPQGPGPPYRGLYADGFHPNDRGYLQWADALSEALGLQEGGHV